jgi:hypothetical protein
MTASIPTEYPKAFIPSRPYKTQAAAARFAVQQSIGQPTLRGILEYAPLSKASPQAEGSQDKTAPLKEELFSQIPSLTLSSTIFEYHAFCSSFDSRRRSRSETKRTRPILAVQCAYPPGELRLEEQGSE